MKIRTRLLLTFILVSVVLGGTVVYVLSARRVVNTRTQELRERVSVPLAWANDLKNGNDAELTWLVGGARLDASGVPRGARDARFNEDPNHTYVLEEQRISRALAGLGGADLPPGQRENLAAYAKATSALQGGIAAEVGATTAAPVGGEPAASPERTLDLLWERSRLADPLIASLTDAQQTQLAELQQQYDTTQRNATVALIGGFGLALVLGLVLAGRIVRPVRRTVRVLEKVADGDLTPRLGARRDEIGQMGAALNRTLDQVSAVVEVISESANELAATSTGFRDRSRQLASAIAPLADDPEAVTRQARAMSAGVAGVVATTDRLRQAAGAVEDLARGADQAAERARAVAEAARDTLQGALAGEHGSDWAGEASTRAARAAAAAAELRDAVAGLGDLRARLVQRVEDEQAAAAELGLAADDVAASSGSVGDRLGSATVAVDLARAFVDDAHTESERLAALAEQLETLTAVFTCERPQPGADTGAPVAPRRRGARVSIRTRLLAGLGVVALAFGAVAGCALRDLDQARQRTQTMRAESLEPLVHLRRLRAAADEGVDFGTVLLFEAGVPKGPVISGMVAGDRAMVAELHALGAYRLPPAIEADLATVVQITSGLERYTNTALNSNIPIIDPFAPVIPVNELGNALRARSDAIGHAVNEMVAREHQEGQALVDSYTTARRNLIVALVGAAGLAVAVALVIAGQIVRPVRRMVAALDRVADGDLTPRLATGRDEVGQMGAALNRTLDNVSSVIGTIDACAADLAAQSSTLTERSAQLAATVTSLAGDADATAAGAREVGSGIATVTHATAELTQTVDAAVEATRAATRVSERIASMAASIEVRMTTVTELAAGGDEGAELRSEVIGAAAAADELVDALDALGRPDGEVQGATDPPTAIVDRVGEAAEVLRRASGTVDARVTAVAGAVSATSRFIDETEADAATLAELADQLETLTSVLQVSRG